MTLKEENRDLLQVPDNYYIVHCISEDFALGVSIALKINNKYNIKQELLHLYHDYLNNWESGICIIIGNVIKPYN